MARERRRSRVLEYFEQQQAQREREEAAAQAAAQQQQQPQPPANPAEAPQAGGDNPFQEFDAAFGLDFGGDPKGTQ